MSAAMILKGSARISKSVVNAANSLENKIEGWWMKSRMMAAIQSFGAAREPLLSLPPLTAPHDKRTNHDPAVP